MQSILCLITSLTSHKLSTAFKVYTVDKMLVFVSNLHTEWHIISIRITWQKIPNNVIPHKDEFFNHNKPN
jgi:hypothetical protein